MGIGEDKTIRKLFGGARLLFERNRSNDGKSREDREAGVSANRESPSTFAELAVAP
ncbi:MAG TPA: hypothetical protein VIE47_07245 [Methylocystis sp.]